MFNDKLYLVYSFLSENLVLIYYILPLMLSIKPVSLENAYFSQLILICTKSFFHPHRSALSLGLDFYEN